MRSRHSRLAVLLVAFALAPMLAASEAIAQATQAKRPISYDAYDSWKSIRGTKLSDTGTWLAYGLAAQEGDGELVVRNLKTGSEFRHPRGESPVITADGRFVVFTIVPAKADVDQAKKDKKKPEEMPKNALGIMSLADGRVQSVDRVKSFRVPELAPSWVAYLKEKAPPAKDAAKPDVAKAETPEGEKKPKEKKKEPGTDLFIRDLATGAETVVPEVVEYAWNRDGGWLAYGVSSKTAANDGAFARKTSDGSTVALLKGKGNYKRFAFDEAGAQLAFLSDQAEYASEVSPYRLYHWAAGAPAAAEIVSASTAGMPRDFVVSDNGSLQFSKDGARLFIGTAPKPEPPRDEDAPAPLKVDLWHWKDPLLQPMQAVRAEQMRNRNFRGVVHLKDKRFVQLALPEMPQVAVGDDPSFLLGQSDVPYQQLISWDAGYDDVFVVNVATGERSPVLEKSYYGASLAPGGKYVMYFDEATADWWTYRTSDGRRVNLTAGIDAGVIWVDETHDTPNLPRPYGIAGWTADDKLVLVNDRYDIWALSPDGSTAPRNATAGRGRAEQLVFRYQRLDPEERVIPSGTPVLLDTTNHRTKASGFYRATLAGTPAAAAPVKVVMMDKGFGSPIKAKKADVVVFTLSRFEEFPNLWTSDLSFSNPQKVSDANPQMAQYVWGTSELIEYVNNDGRTLRAILTKPDNFDPSKTYPMMVYIYEELSQGLHSFTNPGPGTSVNITRYVSNGYVVLRPDIVYDTGYPGEAAEKCVIPAVQKVLAMGFVDPKRVGIQGHSWGGYQITHLITRSDIFRAVEAGAPVANMISAYGGIRWGSGMSRAFQYERTQSRIGGPPWDNTLEYIENSPIFWAEKVNTPYLTIHNDEDDAVPWYQGIEFFNALRRLGKEAYFFNYNTEKHGLRQRENQKHWTVHMDEFFDHFLKGTPKPEWMEKGVPYLERGRRDVSDLFKPKVPTETTQAGKTKD